MNFETKVKEMEIYEIVETMIDGLKNPVTKINMRTFGYFDNDVCYGCAATNAVCKIAGIVPDIKFSGAFGQWRARAASKQLKADYHFVDFFEEAIDELRKGDTSEYNMYASDIGIALIPNEFLDYELPFLRAKNYLEELPAYEQFAKDLRSQE